MKICSNFVERNKSLLTDYKISTTPSDIRIIKYMYCDTPAIEIYFKGIWYIIMKNRIRKRDGLLFDRDPLKFYDRDEKVRNPPKELLELQKNVSW